MLSNWLFAHGSFPWLVAGAQPFKQAVLSSSASSLPPQKPDPQPWLHLTSNTMEPFGTIPRELPCSHSQSFAVAIAVQRLCENWRGSWTETQPPQSSHGVLDLCILCMAAASPACGEDGDHCPIANTEVKGCAVPLAWPFMYCCSHSCRSCFSKTGATNSTQPTHLLPLPFVGARPFTLPPARALGASSLPVTGVFPVAVSTPPPYTRDMQGVDLTGHELKAH